MRVRTVTGVLTMLALVAGLTPASGAAPDAGGPSLALRRTSSEAIAYKVGTRKPRVQLPIFLQAQDAPLDLRVRRASYQDPLTVTQVLHGENGTETVELPANIAEGWRGLAGFFKFQVRRLDGRLAYSATQRFCPNTSERQRISDNGPATPTFPFRCYGSGGSNFLKGMVWGIDEDWATPLTGWRGVTLDVPRGRYKLTVSIAPRYQELFGIDPAKATTTLDLTVRKVARRCCFELAGAQTPAERSSAATAQPPTATQPTVRVPTMENPDPSLLPDLEAVPAFWMGVENRRNGQSRLGFASMIWVSGASSLVVEGFRRSDEDVMDAYQYFYDRDELVGRAPVGTFKFDRRNGHNHWHIKQFARYRMIDMDTNEVVRSSKQSFCLFPTDPVDLALDNAVVEPWRSDFHTACGGSEALWIREVLPLGWGDTYYQSGGQAFNITSLPNGRYRVEVQANPLGVLHEQDVSNNSVKRTVILRGKPGNRRVAVRPWRGIDF